MLFRNVKYFDSDFVLQNGDICVEDGRFSLSATGEVIDCSGLMMFPGLIDIHTHGALGFDNMDPTPLAIHKIAGFMAQNGVTAYLPTLITQSRDNMCAAARNIAAVKKDGSGGAKIAGIYMEGPYFSEKYKGAQNAEFLRDPDIDEFCEINAASGGLIRIISLAPERAGSAEFIEKVSKVCKVAIGHTDSDYETAKQAIALGAHHLTHTFNAMRGLHHRSPNAIGAAWESTATCECICDGMHVHPAAVRILFNTVGADRVVLVSDSLRAAGMPDGEYELGGQITYVKNSEARLKDGTIAGSTATLFGCVKKAVEFGISLSNAVRSASYVPACAAGIDNEYGVIKPGRAADFLLVNDRLELVSVYIDGMKYR